MTEGKNKSRPEDSQHKMETHIEEDDEFEEFPQQDWQVKDGAEDEEVRYYCMFEIYTFALSSLLMCNAELISSVYSTLTFHFDLW